MRLHRKINKDGLKVAIGRYARNANDGLVGHEEKEETLPREGERASEISRHRDLPIIFKFIRETRRMQTDMKKHQMGPR